MLWVLIISLYIKANINYIKFIKMANKLIIDNRTDLSDFEVLELISKVIKMGRISNNGKQYCYGTAINSFGKLYGIWTDLNEKSDRFVIMDKSD